MHRLYKQDAIGRVGIDLKWGFRDFVNAIWIQEAEDGIAGILAIHIFHPCALTHGAGIQCLNQVGGAILRLVEHPC